MSQLCRPSDVRSGPVIAAYINCAVWAGPASNVCALCGSVRIVIHNPHTYGLRHTNIHCKWDIRTVIVDNISECNNNYNYDKIFME